MNNYEYQGEQEPTECSECFSAMTEGDGFLVCDNNSCDNAIELEEY